MTAKDTTVENMFAKRVLALVVLAFLSGSILTTLGLLKFEAIRMADFSADRFGFPYWWVEHVTDTFAGPADYWHVEMPSLAENIALYFLLGLGFWFAIPVWRRRIAGRANVSRIEKVALPSK